MLGDWDAATPRVQRALYATVVADRAAVVAERDRYRQALDQAVDELMVGDTTTALSILQRALNQTCVSEEDR